MITSEIAKDIAGHLREAGFSDPIIQVLMLAEETGEFVGAYRRYSGNARRSGSFDDVQAELADVIIGAFVAADYLGVDLDAAVEAKLKKIYSRGWRDDH